MKAPGPGERIVDVGAGTPRFLGWARDVTTRLLGMPPQAFGTAAPTTGAHDRGEIVWNSAPTGGQPLLWCCTVAGTPGTWVGLTLS